MEYGKTLVRHGVTYLTCSLHFLRIEVAMSVIFAIVALSLFVLFVLVFLPFLFLVFLPFLFLIFLPFLFLFLLFLVFLVFPVFLFFLFLVKIPSRTIAHDYVWTLFHGNCKPASEVKSGIKVLGYSA